MDLLEILSYSLLDYFPCVKSLKNIHLYSNYVALIYLLWQITQIGVWRRFRKTTAGRNTGQLEAETYAMSLGKVYTFGPTFRAENSNTSRHLAEFWMVEPEVAFMDLAGNMDLAEDFMKYVISIIPGGIV